MTYLGILVNCALFFSRLKPIMYCVPIKVTLQCLPLENNLLCFIVLTQQNLALTAPTIIFGLLPSTIPSPIPLLSCKFMTSEDVLKSVIFIRNYTGSDTLPGLWITSIFIGLGPKKQVQ